MVLAIIGQHHGLADGSGYPAGLKGDAIQLLARIMVIANYYDDLCNPNAIADALTPHEALSLMFAKLCSKFDAKFLPVLVRCLGVYPREPLCSCPTEPSAWCPRSTRPAP